MLILDSSGSIGDNATNVTNAARGFLTALAGTGSQVAIVDFDATASNPLAVPYTLVTAASIAETGLFGTYLNVVSARTARRTGRTRSSAPSRPTQSPEDPSPTW